MKGKVQTVCGLIEPSELGLTLPHEHLLIDLKFLLQAPLNKSHLTRSPFTLQNLGWIRQFPYSHIPNLDIRSPESEEPLLDDLAAFKAAGGGTLVENTPKGIGRDVCFMRRASKQTGVHIVAGTAFFIEANADMATLNMTVEQMAEELTSDLICGCRENPAIKCGILGEVGCSWPITEFEKRSLRAAGEVEASVGCPVMIHTGGKSSEAPIEALRTFTEAGGNASRAVLAHLDRFSADYESMSEIFSYKSYLECDLFGVETSYFQFDDVDMPSDAQRIRFIKRLIEDGHLNKLLLSHDIHTKHRMKAFGGHGFTHLLNNVRPQMVSRGITQEQSDVIMLENPARWLTFSK